MSPILNPPFSASAGTFASTKNSLVSLDMALIRFVILDDDFIGDEFIGQYTIAYSCLLPGYRILKLHGIFGEELEGASLLVHIQSSSAREMGKKKTMLRRRPNRSTG